jgi:hypothetical protein
MIPLHSLFFLPTPDLKCCSACYHEPWVGRFRGSACSYAAAASGGGSWAASGSNTYVTPHRFLINPNRRSTLLAMVKSRSTWVLTFKKSPTNSNDTFDQVDTHVGSTHGQSLGQTPLKP